MSGVAEVGRRRAFAVRSLINLAKGIAKFGLGAGLVGYLVWRHRADLASLRGRDIAFELIALCLIVTLAGILLTFYRWLILVRAQGLPFGFGQAVRLGFVGYFFNLVLPSAVGGDIVKSVMMARSHDRRAVAVATVWIDRLLGMLGLLWLASIAAGVALSGPPSGLDRIAQLMLLLAAGATLGFILLLSPRLYRSRLAAWACGLRFVGPTLAELFGTMAAYRQHWRQLLLAQMVSVSVHVTLISAMFIGGLAIWEQPPPATLHYLLTPLGLMFGALPLTPGGLGVTEIALDRLYVGAGLDGADALVMMLALRAVQLVIALFGGALTLTYLKERRTVMGATAAAPSDR